MAKQLTKKDETYLKRYAKGRTLAELAQRFGTETATIAEALKRLGLSAKDAVSLKDDPQVKKYEKAIAAMEKGKWAAAAKQFEAVAGETDRADLAARARQYMRLCRSRSSKPPEADDDPFLLAVYERNRGKLEAALELCKRGGRQSKDERFAYLAASLYALQGDAENAARFLRVAVELNPKNRIHAYFDRDFDTIRGERENADLFASA